MLVDQEDKFLFVTLQKGVFCFESKLKRLISMCYNFNNNPCAVRFHMFERVHFLLDCKTTRTVSYICLSFRK